jgi:hypothetical protein
MSNGDETGLYDDDGTLRLVLWRHGQRATESMWSP